MCYPYETFDGSDGGYIPPLHLRTWLARWLIGDATAAEMKSAYAMTVPQAAEFDELLAVVPTSLLSVVNGVRRAVWPEWVTGVLTFGTEQLFGLNTPALVRAELGLT